MDKLTRACSMKELYSLHVFGDILEEAIAETASEEVRLLADRAARDSIGPHWYGMRCQMQSLRTGGFFYLHIGLIYHKDTRIGLMVELDQKNNSYAYEAVWQHLRQRPEFEINREEPEYLKLFLPDAIFQALAVQSRTEQRSCMSTYIQAAAEAIAQAAMETGFALSYADLTAIRQLGECCKKVITETKSPLFEVQIHEKDPDNFGQYALGYRYRLWDKNRSTEGLYAYFGVIFSYKKRPGGLFAEIDWQSNQRDFDQVFQAMEESDGYEISRCEPKFLKLFLKAEQENEFWQASAKRQYGIAQAFYQECSEQMVRAFQSDVINNLNQ